VSIATSHVHSWKTKIFKKSKSGGQMIQQSMSYSWKIRRRFILLGRRNGERKKKQLGQSATLPCPPLEPLVSTVPFHHVSTAPAARLARVAALVATSMTPFHHVSATPSPSRPHKFIYVTRKKGEKFPGRQEKDPTPSGTCPISAQRRRSSQPRLEASSPVPSTC